MSKLARKLLRLTSLILLVTSFLAACAPPAVPTATLSQPAPVVPSSTITHTPIPSLTFTPAPTVTPTRTLTPTYLPITPVLQGTRLPDSGGVISASNAERLTMLARWGLGNPNDLVYTPDGQYLIVACTSGVYFYDPVDTSLVRQIDTTYLPWHLAVSPDSQMLAVAGPEQVYLYQLSDLLLLRTFSTQANSLDFSPDGQTLAVGVSAHTLDSIQFWDVLNGEIQNVIQSDMGIWSVEFSPQGGYIASGGWSTKVWSLDGTLTTERTHNYSGSRTVSISFSPDGSLFAENSDITIHIWRLLGNGRITHYRQIDLKNIGYASIDEVSISPDGSMVAATLARNGVYAWDLETGYRVFRAPADDIPLYTGLAWSADSRHIAAASTASGVQVWEVPSEEFLASLQPYTGSYTSLAWSPDGQVLAAGAEEGWAHLMKANDGNLLQRLGSGANLNSLAFAPDGQLIALGDINHNVELWALDGNLIRTLQGVGYGANEVRFSTGGELISVNFSDDRQTEQASVWNTADWSLASTFPVGPWDDYQITGFELAPDLQTAAINIVDSSDDHHQDLIRIVTYPDGEPVTTLESFRMQSGADIEATAYSPSGELLAIFIEFYRDYPRLQVWRTNDWTQIYTISVVPDQVRSGWASALQDSLAWSPDSTLLALGLSDGSIQLFNATNGELLITLPGHRMGAVGVAFSPDGRILASCSIDGTIMLWGTR
jgi:WD40 repeat protein